MSFHTIETDSVTTMSSPLTLTPHGLYCRGMLLE